MLSELTAFLKSNRSPSRRVAPPLIPFPLPPADDAIVRVEGLRKVYDANGSNPIEVLKGVNLTVRSGEFVAIIGQSGSGKSTLLNILGALDTPTEGTVSIAGQGIRGLDPDALASLRNRTIGFVFQFHHLLEECTCLENALMPIRIATGRITEADLARATLLLERVGLGTQLRKYPGAMSGGQRQRCAIVRALINRPRLVLADEPTGNLDSRSGQEVFALMREMNAETGAAFILITHDDRLAQAADRVARMEDGQLHEE